MNKLLPFFVFLIAFISCTDEGSERKPAGDSGLKLLASPATDSCAEPFLFSDKNGSVYLSWIEKNGKQSSLRFSKLSHDEWSAPVTIASGNNWFVNWADYPVLCTDGGNNMIAHFLAKSDTAKFTYDIKLVSSSDSGRSWSSSKIVHDDGKKAEHGFVSIALWDDKFFIAWLDGRNTMMEGDAGGHEGHHGQMTIRGAILAKNGSKENEWELDNRVCDCCQTSAAVTENGPVVVYRDRSEEEIRDISLVRYVNGRWTAPQIIFPDRWKITGCPVNGPRIDAKGNNLAIAWFSMADKNGQVNLIFSEDGGGTLKKPVRIDEGKPIGRVDVVMLDSATAMVSWMEGATIKARKVHADGTTEPSIIIAHSSESRSGGFPQMTRSGNSLFFAWTDTKDKTIKVASLTF
jgi:hypothetical protein